jgi:hypothetical protein
MLAHSSGSAVVKRGGSSWFFVAADYSFGQQLVKDASCTRCLFISNMVSLSLPTTFRSLPSARISRRLRG